MGHLHFHVVLIRRAPRERPQGRVTRRGLSDITHSRHSTPSTQRKHATEKNDPAETDQNTYSISKAIMQFRISCKIIEQHKITPLRKCLVVFFSTFVITYVAKSVFSESTSYLLVTTRLDHDILEKLCYVDKRMLLLASVRQLTRSRHTTTTWPNSHSQR